MIENGAETGEKRLFLCFFVRGTAVIGMSRLFVCWDCSQDAELGLDVSFFLNSSDGPSSVALFIGVRSPVR